VDELAPGFWTWTAPHPDWTPDQGGPEGWERDVRSAALADGDELVLLDPLDPPPAVVELAGGRGVSVVLTCGWHRRSARDLAERLNATVYAPGAGIDAVEIPGARPYGVGDRLPGGVTAAAAYYPEEVVLWLPGPRALFAGDAFAAPPLRFQRAWLPPGTTVEEALPRLRPLLDLPVEIVVVGHGEPVRDGAHEALARALEE
jgi:glyoxylase-like metal-dependent hydrolase (beta-lactamase superfamily II)